MGYGQAISVPSDQHVDGDAIRSDEGSRYTQVCLQKKLGLTVLRFHFHEHSSLVFPPCSQLNCPLPLVSTLFIPSLDIEQPLYSGHSRQVQLALCDSQMHVDLTE